MTLLALHICSTVHLLRLLLLLLLSTRFCFLCGPARQGDIRSAIAIALTLMCVFINTKTTKQSECHDTFCLWPVSLVLLNLMNKCHGEEEPFSCSAWQSTEGASEIFLLCLFVLPFLLLLLFILFDAGNTNEWWKSLCRLWFLYNNSLRIAMLSLFGALICALRCQQNMYAINIKP